MDHAWALVRMTQLKLFDVSPFPSEKQTVSGWSGLNAVGHSSVPAQTNIGYCPMIVGYSTEFSSVYTVMKIVHYTMVLLGQNDTIITFRLAIYVKAMQIQWSLRQLFESMVIRMDGFHIAMNYIVVLGKKYQLSGIDDLLIESGMHGSLTTSIMLKGMSYNRGGRAYNIVLEARFLLQWRAMAISTWGHWRGWNSCDWASYRMSKTLDEGKRVPTDCILYSMPSSYCSQSSRRSNLRHEHNSKLFVFLSYYVCMMQLLLNAVHQSKEDRKLASAFVCNCCSDTEHLLNGAAQLFQVASRLPS